MENPVQKKLLEKFGNAINHMSCVYINEGEKHMRHLVGNAKIKRRTCIEIGTWNAVSACILGEFFDRVVTIDIAKQPLAETIIDFLGMRGKVFTHIVKNDEAKIDIINREFETGLVDMVFIDGGHSKSQLNLDWNATKDKCCSILIHDYEQHFTDVYDYVNAISGWEKSFSGLFAMLSRREEGEYKPAIDMRGKRPPMMPGSKKGKNNAV